MSKEISITICLKSMDRILTWLKHKSMEITCLNGSNGNKSDDRAGVVLPSQRTVFQQGTLSHFSLR